jgi:putative DNA primase/helicase
MDIELVRQNALRLLNHQIRNGYSLTNIHTYTDLLGSPIFYRLRLRNSDKGRKGIYPLRFSNGAWELKEPKFTNGKPIYNIHELSEANLVFFVEGEACVDALKKYGIVATTSGGATSHEKADFSPLAGKTIFIWPDNDMPGCEHAKAVATQLLDLGCNVEKIAIDTLDLPKSGDVIDWLDSHPDATNEDIFGLKRDKLPLDLPRILSSGDHLSIAKAVIDEIGRDDLIYSDGFLWKWSKAGVWQIADDREIKKIIHQVINDGKVTANLVNSTFDLIKTESYRAGCKFDQNTSSINCSNGEISFENGGWTLTLHEKTNYRTTLIPVAYDPAAQASSFERFIAEIFNGDSDAKEKISIVYEAIGYSLLSTAYLEKFVMLIGSGANGKSVLMSVLISLLGKNNVTAVQPDQFESRFQRAHFHGKLANVITEIKEGGEIADAQLKSLVSGEMTTAEHKFKEPFEFIPFATHWFGTNHMPHTRDFSDALFRRAIILTFNNKFEGKNCDVHLIEKLKTELPGVLNLALCGLSRLFKNNSFTTSPSSIKAINEWKLEADQVAQFVADQCTLKNNASISSGELYKEYKAWADEVGIQKTLGQKNFTTRLIRLGCSKGRGTGGSRQILGIAFNAPEPPF